MCSTLIFTYLFDSILFNRKSNQVIIRTRNALNVAKSMSEQKLLQTQHDILVRSKYFGLQKLQLNKIASNPNINFRCNITKLKKTAFNLHRAI